MNKRSRDAAPEVAKIAPELRRVFPDIPAPIELPPDQQRRFLFNAYQAFTERAARAIPMVLVLEDLHWADEPTVLLMQHLAQHLAPLPLLVVGTYRDVELDVGRPWAKVLETLVRERLATRITLRRLPETDVEQMLEALSGQPAAHAGATEKDAAALAHHFYQAGSMADADKTLRYLTLAGNQAAAANAFEDAVSSYTTALSFERLDGRARADLLFERGKALRSLSQADDAIADLQASLSAYEALGDAAAVSRTVWDLDYILLWQDRGADALVVTERAERVVPEEATPERSRVLAMLGACHGWQGDYTTCLQRITEARVIAERLEDQRLLGQALSGQTSMAWIFLKIRQQIDTGRGGVEASRAAGDVWELANTLSFLGLGLVSSGAPEEARRVADEAEELAGLVRRCGGECRHRSRGGDRHAERRSGRGGTLGSEHVGRPRTRRSVVVRRSGVALDEPLLEGRMGRGRPVL